MRVLFTTTPGRGHWSAMTPLAEAGRERGHQVLWATAPAACAELRERGWNAVSELPPDALHQSNPRRFDMSPIHGSCLCGSVTLEVRDPQMLLECHCTRCRKWTGCASTPAVVVSGQNLEQTAGADLLKGYKADGFSERYFCTGCGTSLFSGGPDTYYVNAGVLEEPALGIACHIQVADKAAWHEIGGAAPQYAAFPG